MDRVPAALALAFLFIASASPAQSPRFFFSGDGFFDLYHARFDERIAIQYRDRLGRYDPVALERIAYFLRSRDDGKVGRISLRLIELIDFVEDRVRPQRTVLVSGYRSPTFNDKLRRQGSQVADASLHTEGMAVDVQLVGADLHAVWIDLRKLKVGGVGYYKREGFLHLDTGPPRFWDESTSAVSENLSKGNARLFGRTEFDRYGDLDGALISLHRVTAFPVRIGRKARFEGRELALQPLSDALGAEGECFLITQPTSDYRFRVEKPDTAFPVHRGEIEILTCPPRVDATPEGVKTNRIERLPAQEP